MTADFEDVSLDGVSRHFGRRWALSNVSFSFRAGEILGLVGPNGAGKSTLLSMLSTLLTPSRGEIRYGSLTARSAGPALRARLGFLAHDLHLYADLSGRENLEFFARLHGPDDKPTTRVDAALDAATLSARGGDMVSTYSRGMRQRLALECALIHGPRLVLLDEPFTGLDESASAALRDRLGGLRSSGCLVAIATHDLDAIDVLLDRAVLLRDGCAAATLAGGSGLRERYRHALSLP